MFACFSTSAALWFSKSLTEGFYVGPALSSKMFGAETQFTCVYTSDIQCWQMLKHWTCPLIRYETISRSLGMCTWYSRLWKLWTPGFIYIYTIIWSVKYWLKVINTDKGGLHLKVHKNGIREDNWTSKQIMWPRDSDESQDVTKESSLLISLRQLY